MNDSHARSPEVTPCMPRTMPPSRHMASVNAEVYRWLVDMIGISNREMARATGMSESYAAQ